MRHRVEQADHRHRGARHRQHDVDQHGDVVGAVDERRILQLLRHGLKEGAHDDQVPHRDRHRHHQCPDGVVHPQIAHQQVGGDQPAAEEEGHHHQSGDEAAKQQPLLGQGVGHGDRHHHVHGGAHHRVEDGVLERVGDGGVAQDQLVGAQVGIQRIEGDRVRLDVQVAAQRHRCDVQDRVQGDSHDEQDHDVDGEPEQPAGE